MNLFRSTAGACALVLVACGVASAGEPPPPPTQTSTGNAMRVIIDPLTGKPRQPTAAELQVLNAQWRARPQRMFPTQPATEAEAAATLRRHPSGMMSMAVPESLFSSLHAEADAEGQLHVHHADPAHATHDEDARTQELPHE